MKKSTKKGVTIAVIAILVFALSGAVAYAATNISEIEELYLAFRTAQTQAAVENGDMTAEEAEEYLEKLTENMEKDEQDAVAPLPTDKGDGRHGMGRIMPFADAIDLYADMSDMTADEIKSALSETDETLFKLAQDSGLLNELKAAMLAESNAKIDTLLEEEEITQEQADKIKTRIEEIVGSITADTQCGGKDMRSGKLGRQDMHEKLF